ncbi:V-set and immunoglobulin domain-containing protein 2-like [Hoplias malabaricus]|uniref:V-set and immunoglobulin domain-containing protein 2-like n=1 Tax=Hoplias malabaricus TaxID=27720 RepID=UPI0034618A4A
MALIQNPPVSGVASVKILSVQPSDTGIYICDVTNPHDWSGSGQGLINLTVLVPPSVPVCQLSGSTYVGDDVTLICTSTQGFPTPIYSWSREKDAGPLPPNGMVEDQRAGSLVLTNLSDAFAGTYTCRASNVLGVEACSVAVKVAYGGTAAVVGGALMGVFLFILLIAAVAAYLFCYRKRNTQPSQRNEMRQVNVDQSGSRKSKVRLLSGRPQEHNPPLRVSHFSPLV